jgi:hypothetical protein
MKARLVAGNHNKSRGASCIQHLALEPRNMKLEACKADPDLWLREPKKVDGTMYYEYVVGLDGWLTIKQHEL